MQQQTALAMPPNPVILSGTEHRRREVKSKDPEVASLTIERQGVLTNIYPLFYSSTL
jgi:hypothetical protein